MIPDSMQLKAGPVLAPWPGTRPDCNWYISVVFTLPALLQPLCTQFGCTFAVAFVTLLAYSWKLLHCGVPGCSDCSVAVLYLKWPDACVGRDQHLCLLSHRGISTYVLLFCLSGRSPEAYSRVCMAFTHISLQRLKTKCWNLQQLSIMQQWLGSLFSKF